jgi:glycosyltransferase involved in cell wall biosynthesis
MKVNVLHLTHTEISRDSRILKEAKCIASLNTLYNVSGIGIKKDEGSSPISDLNGLVIHSITLKSKKLIFIPRVLRHTFCFIELTLKMIINALKLKPKIIHCNDVTVLPIGAILKLLTRAKLIYDAHELESEVYGISKMFGKFTLMTEKFCWRLIDSLIVVSPSIKLWYETNIGEKNIEIILNSPVLMDNDDEIDKLYLRRKYSIADNSKIFLYVGMFQRNRGLSLIVEAFQCKALNSHLVFLGYGELKSELEQIAKKCSNIHVHESVTHERVVSVAKSADVGLCFIENLSLSDFYCLPNKLFEYCFAEIPVLASNFPDLNYMVSRYNLGQCSEASVRGIRDAIFKFEAMNNLPSINAKNLYELSWQYQEVKLINLYSEL